MEEETLILKKCKTCLILLSKDKFPKKRDSCKECVSKELMCIHNKRKRRCIECGGNEICEHNIIKYRCKLCKGNEICIHNKRKTRCSECGGGSLCIHKIVKSRCIECGGSEICIHKKRKNVCVDCNGSSICVHKKNKNKCVECGGSYTCIHMKRKDNCLICNPKIACEDCKNIYADKRSQFYPLCQACFCNKYPDHEKSTLYKIKERYLRDELRDLFKGYQIDMIFDKTIDGGCSSRRPDILIDCLTHSIVIECDEHQHTNYECENKRTMELFNDLGSRPLVMIRFNPDSYINENEEKVQGCFKPLTNVEDIHKRRFYDVDYTEWDRRIIILEEVICSYIDLKTFPNKELTEIKLFYSFKKEH